MRVAIRTLALAATLMAASAASAQTTNQSSASNYLPTFSQARLNMTSALGNIFGIRGLLPSFRNNGQLTGGVPNAVLNGVPDPANSASYLSGFGYRRIGQ